MTAVLIIRLLFALVMVAVILCIVLKSKHPAAVLSGVAAVLTALAAVLAALQ